MLRNVLGFFLLPFSFVSSFTSFPCLLLAYPPQGIIKIPQTQYIRGILSLASQEQKIHFARMRFLLLLLQCYFVRIYCSLYFIAEYVSGCHFVCSVNGSKKIIYVTLIWSSVLLLSQSDGWRTKNCQRIYPYRIRLIYFILWQSVWGDKSFDIFFPFQWFLVMIKNVKYLFWSILISAKIGSCNFANCIVIYNSKFNTTYLNIGKHSVKTILRLEQGF